MKTWIITSVVLIAVRLFSVFSSMGKASRSEGQVTFNVNTPFRLVEALLFGILLGTFITPVLVGNWKSVWWQMLLALIGTVLLARLAPGKITLTGSGIAETRLLGAKHISWGEVESVLENRRKREVVVTGNDGTEIVHTDMHVSAGEFVRELEKSKLKVYCD